MLSALALLAALHAAPAADSLSGTWRFTGDVAGNALDATCTLRQSGETLTGECPGPTGERMPMTGELKDGRVTIRQKRDYQGQEIMLIYTTTAATARELKGTVEVLPFNVSGTFAATMAPTKP